MTGGIYRSEFEAMKAPHIMRRRVSMEEALHEFLLEKTNSGIVFWKD